jgi:hypothetical protein
MEKFSLDIDLGNAAMQSPRGVADALRRTADQISAIDGYPGEGMIRDLNGNRVGGWGFDQLADKRPSVVTGEAV